MRIGHANDEKLAGRVKCASRKPYSSRAVKRSRLNLYIVANSVNTASLSYPLPPPQLPVRIIEPCNTDGATRASIVEKV